MATITTIVMDGSRKVSDEGSVAFDGALFTSSVADLQIVRQGTGLEVYGLMQKEFASVACPSWLSSGPTDHGSLEWWLVLHPLAPLSPSLSAARTTDASADPVPSLLVQGATPRKREVETAARHEDH